MKKVLVIAPYNYLPHFSGGQKFIAKFLEYLGNETDLTVITVKENDFTLARNYKTLALLRKKTFSRYSDVKLSSTLTALIRNEKFDTVIWEHPYYAWLAYLVKKRTGIKTILHSHNIEYQRFRSIGKSWWRILKRYEKWFFSFADKIFFITEDDKDFAIKSWKIAPSKCIEVPFGIEEKEFPRDRNEAKISVCDQHNIHLENKILLFNGLLDYKPNVDALKNILGVINPQLKKEPAFQYKIIITGKRLPPEFNNLEDYKNENVIYAGFVESIEKYFKAADIFLNPVLAGGGIKTKMVEAIGFGATVVATESGAAGIHKELCGNKLITVEDNDWPAFVSNVVRNASLSFETPAAFYEKYFLGNIIKKMMEML